MSDPREFPDRPVVGVGGVVIEDGRTLLIRRGSEPLKGQWSIPGGTLEVGETIEEGVRRELREETGLEVRVQELIEVFERIFPEKTAAHAPSSAPPPPLEVAGVDRGPSRPLYHFVILDYLCERVAGEPRAGGDVTDIAFVTEAELARYNLTVAATRVLRKAFALARSRTVK